MFKSYKLSVVISATIPLSAYTVWLMFFSHHHLFLLSSDPEAMITFAIATSGIAAGLSLFFHVVYNFYHIEKLRMSMQRLYEMNSRIQELTEDLSDVSNYNLELVNELSNASKNTQANVGKPPTSKRARLWESAYFYR